MKKPQLQFLLQLPDSDGDRRLCHVKFLRRPGDTVIAADRAEIFQLNQFQECSSLFRLVGAR